MSSFLEGMRPMTRDLVILTCFFFFFLVTIFFVFFGLYFYSSSVFLELRLDSISI